MTTVEERIGDSLLCVRRFLDSARMARSAFERDGDMEQDEWHAKYLYAARLHALKVIELGGTVPAEYVAQLVLGPEAPASKAKAPAKPRCEFYKDIRRWHAIARDLGYDISEGAHDRIRGALSTFFRRRIISREDLTGPEWREAADALKLGALVW